jgi:hypothetical protein
MYIRIYPSKNNTIFKKSFGTTLQTGGNINTGQNPIAELMDGNGYSTVIFQFNIESIKPLLEKYTYKCNMKVWDAGTIFEPVIKLKPIDLFYFKEDFVEGDGFSFLDERALVGISNYNFRDSVNSWSGVFTTGIFPALHLNQANEDLFFQGLENFIEDAVTNNANPNFAFRISTNDVEGETYTKFLHTRHTRTIYKPYLEFFIENEIRDQRYFMTATKPGRLYLQTPSGENLIGTLTVDIKDSTGTTITTLAPINENTGVYYITYTPNMLYKGQYLSDIWIIDGAEVIRTGNFFVKNPNSLLQEDSGGLFFYPTFSYTKPIIRQGDIIKFKVVSEIRGKGAVLKNYEYKVVCTNNFEMQPWTKVNLYDGELYFYIDTSYYFPELEYEVIVRLIDQGIIQTSSTTQKFRVVYDGPTHLQGRFASPYQSRDYYLKR